MFTANRRPLHEHTPSVQLGGVNGAKGPFMAKLSDWWVSTLRWWRGLD